MTKVNIIEVFDGLTDLEKIKLINTVNAKLPDIKKTVKEELSKKYHSILSKKINKDWKSNTSQYDFDDGISLLYVLKIDDKRSFVCDCQYSLKENYEVLEAKISLNIKRSYGQESFIFKTTNDTEYIQTLLSRSLMDMTKLFDNILKENIEETTDSQPNNSSCHICKSSPDMYKPPFSMCRGCGKFFCEMDAGDGVDETGDLETCDYCQ